MSSSDAQYLSSLERAPSPASYPAGTGALSFKDPVAGTDIQSVSRISSSRVDGADVDRSVGNHFSCSLSSVLVARVYEHGGDGAVDALLSRAGSRRTRAYLCDLANWIAYDEAIALLRAGAEITHHPAFGRAVGQDAARRLNGSPVAAVLRSLGSPENGYRQVAVTAAKYTTVSTLRALDCGPGHAHLEARAIDGFPRSAAHCEWTTGLISCMTELFGLPPATVEHETCAAYGAAACHYHVSWAAHAARERSHSTEELDKLRDQLEAMRERLHSMFQTAADLISSGDVDDVLSRIAERAATEVRAPRHLLAVRMRAGDRLHLHHRGFDEAEADAAAATLLSHHPSDLPESWLAVPIRSNRSDYGSLLAAYPDDARFFPAERDLLEVYGRYAASALDSASALAEAESRYGQSSALLQLARALSVAGTSSEVARRLADSVPVVVDCDQVSVYLWNGVELVRAAVTERPDAPPPAAELAVWTPHPGSTLQRLVDDPRPEPIFIGQTSDDLGHAEALRALGFQATILVPLVGGDVLLGMLAVAVRDRARRLAPTPDLLDRLSGVGAQAATALQNGRLVDIITEQALNDQLTGLANRVRFTTELRDAVGRASSGGALACVFYIDLDRFKPVNDEFGHEAGDELLVAVGERLRSCTRGSDLVARLGGDEFAVLVVALTESDIDGVAERLASGFAAPFKVGGRPYTLSASIGRSVYPADAPDVDSMLRRADRAMFAEKRRRTDARREPARAT